MSRPCSRAKKESDGVDELANALLDDTTLSLAASSPQKKHTSADISTPVSPRSTVEVLNKPLPSLPQASSLSERQLNEKTMPALKSKTTKLKVTEKGKSRPTKLDISSPIPIVQAQDSGSDSNPLGNKQTGRTGQDISGSQTSTIDAALLSSKISNLIMMNEAAAARAQNSRNQPQSKGSTKPEKKQKLPPLQRSKNVLAKAKKAIADRLSSSTERQAKRKENEPKPLDSTLDDAPISQSKFDPEAYRIRHGRRVAEGNNLGNAKIQAIMGDGKIKRKPLPVYESMKSLTRLSDSTHDPCSDESVMDDSFTSKELSGFDFDFDRRGGERVSVQSQEGLPNGVDTMTGSPIEVSLKNTGQDSRFSEMISGLAQHSDTEYFSSSPIDVSTPPILLGSRSDFKGESKSTSDLALSPSLLDFSFEEYSDDDEDVFTHKDGEAELRASSLKRKAAKVDLRSGPAPAPKKSRKDQLFFVEDLTLTTKTGKLDTEERQALSTKDVNKKMGKFDKDGYKAKGLGIFEVGKGKEKTIDEAPKLQSRTGFGKRSSLPRPASTAIGLGIQGTAKHFVYAPEGDSMSLDELQMDKSAYSALGKKA